nr:hypothetical protein [Tanacetum cinerariifolium]
MTKRPEAPPSPDYIPRPEAPPSPDYIPGTEYPEYLPPADDVLPAEEQPPPAAVSSTAESPGYITESEPEMEPKEEEGDDENENLPEADIPLRKRARFTTPTGGYEVGESSVAAAARQIRPALTIADRRRADDRLIGRLRRERQYFRTLSTTYAQEMEALQRDVSTLQRQHIDDEDRLTRHIQHEHAQKDVAPEDGDSCS